MILFKKIILSAIFIVAVFSASAQSKRATELLSIPYIKVVQDDISASIHSATSPYFYPSIYRKYELGDSTMTADEFRHLYYGYMYQQEYQPMKEPKIIDSLSSIIYAQNGVINEKNAAQAVAYLERILEERPFSLKFLNLMSYVYDSILKDRAKAELYSYRLNNVLETIFSSGDGLSESRPWHVLYRDDAQSILGVLGVEVTRRIHVSKDCEYYHLKERQLKAKGYYIDFSRIYTRPIEPTSKRRMEFNPENNPKSKKYINKNIK